MDPQFEILNTDDVLSTSGSHLMFQCTFKVSEFLTMMQAKLEEEELFSEGLTCEVLKPGKNWQKGKLKIRLEFWPDESDLPLSQFPEQISQSQSSPADYL